MTETHGRRATQGPRIAADASETSGPPVLSGSAAPSGSTGVAPVAPASPAHLRLPALLSNRPTLAIGLALTLAATDPSQLARRGPGGWLLTAAALVAAIWAAPVVARRPTATSVDLFALPARHRNTVFAVGCVVVAGFGSPPLWLAAVDAALLLAYLLAVDALAAGPIGARQLQRGVAPLAAAAAGAVALLASQAPVDPGAVWGRIVAALAVAAAALAAGAALRVKRSADEQADPTSDGISTSADTSRA